MSQLKTPDISSPKRVSNGLQISESVNGQQNGSSKTSLLIRSASVGNLCPRIIRSRDWYSLDLFDNLNRAVDEIYQNCEEDESIVECKEAVMVLDNYKQKFTALIEKLNLNIDYESTPPSETFDPKVIPENKVSKPEVVEVIAKTTIEKQLKDVQISVKDTKIVDKQPVVQNKSSAKISTSNPSLNTIAMASKPLKTVVSPPNLSILNATNTEKTVQPVANLAQNMSSEDWTFEENVLYISSCGRRSKKSDIIGFLDHQKLGSFRIEGNQSYNDYNCVPNIINDSIDFKKISKMNINLMEGLEMSSIINDFKPYKLIKWEHFLKWIQKTGCLEKRFRESLPHFISLGGLFTSLMSTPNQKSSESYEILVTKFKDCIFMNKIRFSDYLDNNPFFVSKMTQIITQMDGHSVKEVVNGYEKYFSCFETQIGDHRLMLMSEMDAIDKDDNQYKIKCYNGLNFGRKLFNWWSHCVVADIAYILVGVKDDNEVLKSVHKLKVEKLSEKCNENLSFIFVNRFLAYIKRLLESADDLQVFKVWYKKGDKCVRSVPLLDNNLIPDWFIREVSEEPNDNPMD